ncbi:MAG: hypothetical protein V4614_09050 [Pseudomonadota bacterium]
MRRDELATKYDMIFVGTSMICVLEAVYQSLSGKSVLMLDRQSGMGGAWRSLEIFGLHDVENAIHYFLPDPFAFDFMKDVLKWDVAAVLRKYRVFPLPMRGCWRVPYDDAFGRLVGSIKEGALRGKARDFPALLRRAIMDFLFKSRPTSYYVGGGAPEMLRKVDLILRASDVEVRYSTSIDRIYIDCNAQAVEVLVGEERIFASTIFLTHGSRIPNLTGSSGPFLIDEKLHLRPAVHMLIRDNSPSPMYECIFVADPLIKYVHDVTRNTRESVELVGRKKLLVLALQHDIRESGSVYQAIFEKLKRVGMVSEDAVLEDQYWQDIYLPRLEDSDLQKLKAAFGAQIEYLKTEDFAKGLGFHAQKWATKIRYPGSHD